MLLAANVWSKTIKNKKNGRKRGSHCAENAPHLDFGSIRRASCRADLLLFLFFFLYFYIRIARRKNLLLQVNSVFSQSWKVVPWRKALTSGVSRQRRSGRRRKQSSACFCFTSSDMAWPLHRSPLCTMGFLLNSRPCVCVCACVYVCVSSFLTYFVLTNMPRTLQDKSLRCFLESLTLMFIKCCYSETKLYWHADVLFVLKLYKYICVEAWGIIICFIFSTFAWFS